MDTPRYWKPLVKMRPDQMFRRPEIVAETMAHYGIDEEAAKVKLDEGMGAATYWVNELYQVQVLPCGPEDAMIHLCIRRRDGAAIFDWRHMQQIKNEMVGEEREAFQLFPAESRKVDTSNKYHLFVLPEGAGIDLGWMQRDVQYEERKNVPGLRQRAL